MHLAAGAAPDGAAATCVQLAQDGGLSFHVRQGFLAGYQPFVGVKAVQVWLKSDAQPQNAEQTSTPPGLVGAAGMSDLPGDLDSLRLQCRPLRLCCIPS